MLASSDSHIAFIAAEFRKERLQMGHTSTWLLWRPCRQACMTGTAEGDRTGLYSPDGDRSVASVESIITHTMVSCFILSELSNLARTQLNTRTHAQRTHTPGGLCGRKAGHRWAVHCQTSTCGQKQEKQQYGMCSG